LQIVGILLSSLSASYMPFVIGRFLIGFSGAGSFLTAFVLGNNFSAFLHWRYAFIIKQKLALVSLYCKSRRFKTANIKILSANSTHRS